MFYGLDIPHFVIHLPVVEHVNTSAFCLFWILLHTLVSQFLLPLFWVCSLERSCWPYGNVMLTFWRAAKLFSKVAALFDIMTNNTGFQPLHALSNTY